MLFKMIRAYRRALRDAQEKRTPRMRRINGQCMVYCRVRGAWLPVRFKGE